jgi:6,7-dimethyl-8-ribityllumazine synthase
LRRRRGGQSIKSMAEARYTIIASRFNTEIVDRLISGARTGLTQSGVEWEKVSIFKVPGAFEIPIAVKKAALSGKFDAILAIGCVIRGETPHFEYISNYVSLGIGQVGLETGIPVSFGVLTVNTDEQAMARSDDNAENKGFEAALAAVEMVNLLRQI